MNRDIREPFVVHTEKHGYTIHPFSVAPMSMNDRVSMGFYVMVPVLNEQAGLALCDEIKKRVALKVSSEPELFVFGSAEATKIVQDALWKGAVQPNGDA